MGLSMVVGIYNYSNTVILAYPLPLCPVSFPPEVDGNDEQKALDAICEYIEKGEE